MSQKPQVMMVMRQSPTKLQKPYRLFSCTYTTTFPPFREKNRGAVAVATEFPSEDGIHLYYTVSFFCEWKISLRAALCSTSLTFNSNIKAIRRIASFCRNSCNSTRAAARAKGVKSKVIISSFRLLRGSSYFAGLSTRGRTIHFGHYPSTFYNTLALRSLASKVTPSLR